VRTFEWIRGKMAIFIYYVDGKKVYLYFFMSRTLASSAAVLQASAIFRRTVTVLAMNFLSYATLWMFERWC